MGWTALRREKGYSHKEWFQENVYGDGAKILDLAAKRGVAYAAVLCQPKDGGEPYVTADVILYRWMPHPFVEHNFSYKHMNETMHPAEAECPQRILDLLSPVEAFAEPGSVRHDYASAWREQCREYLERRKRRPNVQKGAVIEFKEGFYYGKKHGVINRFRVIDLRRNLGMTPGRLDIYRLPVDWRDREFVFIERAAEGKARGGEEG
mgnify:CR=1 FL=1